MRRLVPWVALVFSAGALTLSIVRYETPASPPEHSVPGPTLTSGLSSSSEVDEVGEEAKEAVEDLCDAISTAFVNAPVGAISDALEEIKRGC